MKACEHQGLRRGQASPTCFPPEHAAAARQRNSATPWLLSDHSDPPFSLASRPGNPPHVYFVVAGFVRFICYPMAIGGDYGSPFAERRLEKRLGLSRLRVVAFYVFQGQHPNVKILLRLQREESEPLAI